MNQLRYTLTVFVSFTTIACGPPRLGSEPDDDPGGSNSTSSTDSEPTTAGDSMDPEPTSTTWTWHGGTDFWVQCDPFAQDCPDGEKCVAYASTGGNWDANKCVPILGDQKPGEPCWYGGAADATDNCDETSACWDVMDVEGELIGVCHAFCEGNGDYPVCPSQSTCLLSSSGVINLCIYTCDPLLQDCGSGLGCYWASSDFYCAHTTEDIPAGQPCGYINDCAVGLTCLTAEVMPDCQGSSCCAPFCNLELGDPQCESVPGTACVSFFEPGTAPPVYELVGVCASPDVWP